MSKATNEMRTVSEPTVNTADEVASDPNQVKSYRDAQYAPIYQVDSAPQVLSEVKLPYPAEAKRQGIEGPVRLGLSIDASGKVTEVKVLGGPGYGLNEAAREALRRYRFKPATKDGQPVATEIKYTYRFMLD